MKTGSDNFIIPVESEDEEVTPNADRKSKFRAASVLSSIFLAIRENCQTRLIHSIKVGVALVLISLLYLLDPLYEQVGEDAMWAVMTVVVLFEFSTGATLSKGLNRGIGTVLGGGLGCLVVVLAHAVGGVGTGIIIMTSVFLCGAVATYTRLVPCIKRKYDYGAMIFILTFNLIVVSSVRTVSIVELACQRLSTIGIGFAIAIFTSTFITPVWAGDRLHSTLASHFKTLACCLQGLLDEHFKQSAEKEYEQSASIEARCKTVIFSKSEDENLAKFAEWELRHGKFGLFHPWEKYLQIAEVLREIAAIVLSLKACLRSPRQTQSVFQDQSVKESVTAVVGSISWSLNELGQSIANMKRCKGHALSEDRLEVITNKLSHVASSLGNTSSQRLAAASFLFLLTGVIERVEKLGKEVEQLGQLAAFDPS